MFNVTVDDSKLRLIVDFASKRMVNAVRLGINQAGMETASFVKSRYLTGGTTHDRLGVRTGTLSKSARGLKAYVQGDRIVGGSGIGGSLIYAPVHINSQLKGKTIIKPKRRRALAIPFRGYKSRTGSIGYGWQKKSAGEYGKGYLNARIKTKSGTILGRREKGAVTPYFFLTSKVEVPVRVFPEQIIRVRRKYIVETIKKHMANALRKK